ncbi:hypothetical protein HDV00_006865 [Rhizophlyctis rosea]|nr:hypothetical protein HDV00_006865 [Rhizophlyctis rosea]
MHSLHLHTLLDTDPSRFSKFHATLTLPDESKPTFLLDYSKNIITKETFQLLIKLVRDSKVDQWRDKMFSGEHINITEDRAVLHIALRNIVADGAPASAINSDGKNVMEDVHRVLLKMKQCADDIRSGRWVGYTGNAITDVVNIGIGGSDLGPVMATEALKHYSKEGLKVHFVRNIDGTHMAETLKPLNPETSVFIVASKTFTSIETMTNAATAKSWFLENAQDPAHVAKHFIALSTNSKAVSAFGINMSNAFPYSTKSLWASASLSLAICIGFDKFINIVVGGHAMDQHFRTTKLEKNLPIILAMLDIWYREVCGSASRSVLPFEKSLGGFCKYMQKRENKSEGTCTTILPDTFLDLIQDDSRLIPTDFLVPTAKLDAFDESVAEDDMGAGSFEEEYVSYTVKAIDAAAMAEYKQFRGNRPTNIVRYQDLTPSTFDMLIALYEHMDAVSRRMRETRAFYDMLCALEADMEALDNDGTRLDRAFDRLFSGPSGQSKDKLVKEIDDISRDRRERLKSINTRLQAIRDDPMTTDHGQNEHVDGLAEAVRGLTRTEFLSEVLMARVADMAPTPREDEERRLLIRWLTSALTTFNPSATISLYGSYYTGLAVIDSDIDVVVIESGTDSTAEGETAKRDPKKALLAYADLLDSMSNVKGINFERIKRAKHPVANFIDAVTGLEVDISYGSSNGVETGNYVKELITSTPGLSSFVTILKLILRTYNVDDGSRGGLTGYPTVLLSTKFLRELALPEEIVVEQMGRLLIQFLTRYATFPFERRIITMDGITDREPDPGAQMLITDPRDSLKNAAGSCHRISDLRSAFGGAADTIRDAMEGDASRTIFPIPQDCMKIRQSFLDGGGRKDADETPEAVAKREVGEFARRGGGRGGGRSGHGGGRGGRGGRGGGGRGKGAGSGGDSGNGSGWDSGGGSGGSGGGGGGKKRKGQVSTAITPG